MKDHLPVKISVKDLEEIRLIILITSTQDQKGLRRPASQSPGLDSEVEIEIESEDLKLPAGEPSA